MRGRGGGPGGVVVGGRGVRGGGLGEQARRGGGSRRGGRRPVQVQQVVHGGESHGGRVGGSEREWTLLHSVEHHSHQSRDHKVAYYLLAI